MGLLDLLAQAPQQGGGLLGAMWPFSGSAPVLTGDQQKAYKDYQIQMQEQGSKPLPLAEWLKQQAPKQPPPK